MYRSTGIGYARVKINGQSLELDYAKHHPGYNLTNFFQNHVFPEDIGLIKLSTPVKLNNNVKIASLAEKGTSFSDQECIVAGWGRLQPDRLQLVSYINLMFRSQILLTKR